MLLLIDEAGRSAIPALSEYATTVVGRGITLWVAVQALSQLEGVYGRARAETLRNNMESQLYYRPADLETAAYLEKRLGRRSDFAHSHTIRGGEEAASGLSEQAVPLLTAQEIMQLGDTEVIGFHRNLPPFQARRIDWRRFSELFRKRQIVPPSLSPLPGITEAPAHPTGDQPPVVPPWQLDPDLFRSTIPPLSLFGLGKRRRPPTKN